MKELTITIKFRVPDNDLIGEQFIAFTALLRSIISVAFPGYEMDEEPIKAEVE